MYVAPKLVRSTVDDDGEVRDMPPSATHEVVRPEVAQQMHQMMKRVVCEGTATQAQVPGLSVAGKTGTGFIAQANGGYVDENGQKAYYASFVGFLPAEDPQVTILVSIDQPRADSGDRFGGTAAAPGVPAAGADDGPRARHRAAGRLDGLSRVTARADDAASGARPGTTLAALLPDVPAVLTPSIDGDPAATVTAMTHDSRLVAPGHLFACVRGEHHDGHRYAAGAVRDGATALLVEHVVDVGRPVGQLVVADTRLAMGPVASGVYRYPSRALRVVGVTGTNGKTTTCALLAAILRHAGQPTTVIGTLSGTKTTPEAPELQARLAAARDAGDRRRRHGGVVARPGDAPRRRHPFLRRRVHEPRRRPPRPARHARGVLPRQGPVVHARALGRGRRQRR